MKTREKLVSFLKTQVNPLGKGSYPEAVNPLKCAKFCVWEKVVHLCVRVREREVFLVDVFLFSVQGLQLLFDSLKSASLRALAQK